ncbi:hypothetical protein DPMN_193020 [Dreissena polymorpha]|uniref:Uncharacterized protein n=1 Tax=Dreissena polymorpha TaxID=45954 RepID=A0A9D3Y3Z2_DREPO|nr:hypothetical protein DPMN_193020 [Dreissena polymorpha]
MSSGLSWSICRATTFSKFSKYPPICWGVVAFALVVSREIGFSEDNLSPHRFKKL